MPGLAPELRVPWLSGLSGAEYVLLASGSALVEIVAFFIVLAVGVNFTGSLMRAPISRARQTRWSRS